METWASAAGFTIAGKTFIEMLSLPLNHTELNKLKHKIVKATSLFYKSMNNDNVLRPDFGSIIIYHIFRTLCKIAPNALKADYQYFNNKNAYDKKTKWYVPAKISTFKHIIANILERKIKKSIERIVDSEKIENNYERYKNKL